MLIVGPDGGFVEVQPFHAAVVKLFERLEASAFFIRSIEVGANLPTTHVACVLFAQGWDVAAGRSPDEACVRLIMTIMNAADCHHCARPVEFDGENITAPMTVKDRDYLRIDEMQTIPVCTLYFDHRDMQFKKACEGFDPDVEPVSDFRGA